MERFPPPVEETDRVGCHENRITRLQRVCFQQQSKTRRRCTTRRFPRTHFCSISASCFHARLDFAALAAGKGKSINLGMIRSIPFMSSAHPPRIAIGPAKWRWIIREVVKALAAHAPLLEHDPQQTNKPQWSGMGVLDMLPLLRTQCFAGCQRAVVTIQWGDATVQSSDDTARCQQSEHHRTAVYIYCILIFSSSARDGGGGRYGEWSIGKLKYPVGY